MFYHGVCGKMDPKLANKVVDIFVTWQFIRLKIQAKYDYALLKLQKRIESKDFIPLSGAWEELNSETSLFIGGYPT